MKECGDRKERNAWEGIFISGSGGGLKSDKGQQGNSLFYSEMYTYRRLTVVYDARGG